MMTIPLRERETETSYRVSICKQMRTSFDRKVNENLYSRSLRHTNTRHHNAGLRCLFLTTNFGALAAHRCVYWLIFSIASSTVQSMLRHSTNRKNQICPTRYSNHEKRLWLDHLEMNLDLRDQSLSQFHD